VSLDLSLDVLVLLLNNIDITVEVVDIVDQ